MNSEKPSQATRWQQNEHLFWNQGTIRKREKERETCNVYIIWNGRNPNATPNASWFTVTRKWAFVLQRKSVRQLCQANGTISFIHALTVVSCTKYNFNICILFIHAHRYFRSKNWNAQPVLIRTRTHAHGHIGRYLDWIYFNLCFSDA